MDVISIRLTLDGLYASVERSEPHRQGLVQGMPRAELLMGDDDPESGKVLARRGISISVIDNNLHLGVIVTTEDGFEETYSKVITPEQHGFSFSALAQSMATFAAEHSKLPKQVFKCQEVNVLRIILGEVSGLGPPPRINVPPETPTRYGSYRVSSDYRSAALHLGVSPSLKALDAFCGHFDPARYLTTRETTVFAWKPDMKDSFNELSRVLNRDGTLRQRACTWKLSDFEQGNLVSREVEAKPFNHTDPDLDRELKLLLGYNA